MIAWVVDGSIKGENSNPAKAVIRDVCTLLEQPVIVKDKAECDSKGSASIEGYDKTLTYTISPDADIDKESGKITGLTYNQQYVVKVIKGDCEKSSVRFMISDADLDCNPCNNTGVTIPVVEKEEAKCDSKGRASITNYDTTLTYTISPNADIDKETGKIIGLEYNQEYVVSASKDGCVKKSVPFTISDASLNCNPCVDNPVAKPEIKLSDVICDNLTGSAKIMNYDSSLTYKISPKEGVVISTIGEITGLVYNTKYVVKANRDTCSEVSDEFEITFECKSSISLVKKSKPLPKDAKVGDKLTYVFEITNTGEITIKELVLTDNKIGGEVALPKKTLAPKESMTVEADYILTQADFDAGKVKNSATVEGKDVHDKPVKDTSGNTPNDDDETVTVISELSKITLTKTAQFNDENGDGYAQLGESITYTFTVKNVGNVTVKDLKITDKKIEGVITLDKTTLAPSEVAKGSVTYQITKEDLKAGKVENSAVVRGKDIHEHPVDDTSGNTPNDNDKTVTELKKSPIKAEPDSYTFVEEEGGMTDGSIFDNDTLRGQPVKVDEIKFTKDSPATSTGGIIVAEDGTITVLPGTPAKDYVIEYTICEKANPTNCSTAKVVIKVEKTELHIPKGFSPNDDNINETWVIKGLKYAYPNFDIKIYNRWGNSVYDYSNKGKKEGKAWYWDGRSTGRWNVGSNRKVPAGTYFYIINLNDGSGAVKKGWIYVNYQ